MKFYMSFWSGGYLAPFDTPKGKYVYDLHRLALYYINKNYGECHLITDTVSEKYLNKLPFKTITTELDQLNDVESRNWALGKLLAYKTISEKNEPFLHLDYDVFLTKQLPEEFLNSDVFVQSLEQKIYLEYGLSVFEQFVGNRYDIDYVNKLDKSYNMGIFGGKNCSFIKDYAEKSIQFTLDPSNKKLFEMLDDASSRLRVKSLDTLVGKGKGPGPACVAEQYYLWKFANKRNINVRCLFNHLEKESLDEMIKRFNEESMTNGYVHFNYGKYDLRTMMTVQKNIESIDKGILI